MIFLKIMNVNKLRVKTINELINISKKLNISNYNKYEKSEMIYSIIRKISLYNKNLYSDGILEILQDGFGFLRSINYSYSISLDDVYINPSKIKKFDLKTGDFIIGKISMPKIDEKYIVLTEIYKINNKFPNLSKKKIIFENLTPIHTSDMYDLEIYDNITSRIINIISPIGKGQRTLLVSPPKAGKTIMLKSIANSLNIKYKNVYLIILLVDERPEEVTEMFRFVCGEIVASTFDEPINRHVQISEIVVERAKRLVEYKKDVVLLLDSITRLARAYNSISPPSGKILTGGIDSNALQRPKRFFGSARNIEEGGSLTIIATALIDTGSKMDDIIFEEFKGTGNSEIYLDRKISEKRIYPSINLIKSSTRREDLLIEYLKLKKVWMLRKILYSMNDIDSIEFLIKHLKKTKNNNLFLSTVQNFVKKI